MEDRESNLGQPIGVAPQLVVEEKCEKVEKPEPVGDQGLMAKLLGESRRPRGTRPSRNGWSSPEL